MYVFNFQRLPKAQDYNALEKLARSLVFVAAEYDEVAVEPIPM